MPIFLHSAGRGYGSTGMTAPSLKRLLIDLNTLLGQIPQAERADLFYSVAETAEPRRARSEGEQQKDWEAWVSKNWKRQEVLAFDLDAGKGEGERPVDMTRVGDYSDCLGEVLGIEPHRLTIISSGHGLHFLVFLAKPIDDWRFFRSNRKLYRALLDQVEKKLTARGLPGKFDAAVFDHARILRLPGTENRKREPFVQAKLLQLSTEEPYEFSFAKILGLELVPATATLSAAETRQARRNLDREGVLTLCNFLKYTKEHASEVKEPEGYAALQILTHLDSDLSTAREYYSRWTGSSSLSSANPDAKMEHAKNASGPRTCDSIAELRPDLCAGCKVRCKSPILIKRPEFIESEARGFYTPTILDEDGKVKQRGRPHYEDLLKAFIRDTNYVYQTRGKLYWSFTGTHYVPREEVEVKAYAETMMNPKPAESVRSEFAAKARVNRHRTLEELERFFGDTIKNKVNFQNGVLDIETGELLPHSKDFGFKYVLPYAYDPQARAPRFEQFLSEVTLSRQEYREVLLDFLGALFVPGYEGIDAGFWYLQGGGRNGKSTFIRVVKKLVGAPANIELTAADFQADRARFRLSELEGKLLCVLEEVAEDEFPKSLLGILKGLSAGGTFTVERKGKDPYQLTNAAKLLFTGNNPPRLGDVSEAVQRRFILVPFDLNLMDPRCAVQADPMLDSRLAEELPGIFNLALAAREKLLERGKPLLPEGSREHVMDLIRESDSFERWWHERVIPAPEMSCYFKLLYADYQELTERDGVKPRGNKTFGRNLRTKLRSDPGGFKTGRISGGPSEVIVPGIMLKDPGDV